MLLLSPATPHPPPSAPPRVASRLRHGEREPAIRRRALFAGDDEHERRLRVAEACTSAPMLPRDPRKCHTILQLQQARTVAEKQRADRRSREERQAAYYAKHDKLALGVLGPPPSYECCCCACDSCPGLRGYEWFCDPDAECCQCTFCIAGWIIFAGGLTFYLYALIFTVFPNEPSMEDLVLNATNP